MCDLVKSEKSSEFNVLQKGLRKQKDEYKQNISEVRGILEKIAEILESSHDDIVQRQQEIKGIAQRGLNLL